jgi:two-component sensor histidine kinase
MGWRLVAMLMRQLGGTMLLNRAHGTEFAIRFSPRSQG